MSRRRGQKGRSAAPAAAAPAVPILAPIGPRWQVLAIFAGTLAIYAYTLCPTVGGGDSGELVGAACAGGVAHPPGYPIHTLLSRLLLLLPFGSPAWRVNLGSALCDAAAAALVFATVRRLARDARAALVAAGLFALSGCIWRFAVVAEVFALHDLLVALFCWLLVRAVEAEGPPRLGALALTSGLAMANHQTFVFLAGPVWIWLAARTPALLAPRSLGRLVGLLSLGLVPYAYLPLAAASRAAISWGDATTWSGFLDQLLRREYGTFRLFPDDAAGSRFGANLVAYARDVGWDLAGVGVLLAITGALGRTARGARLPLCLASAWLFYAIVFHALANLPLERDPLFLEVQRRFWRAPHVVLSVLAGLGAARALGRLSTRPRLARFGLPACVALVFGQGLVHARESSERGNRAFLLTARAMLAPLPPGALLLTRGDVLVNATRYLQTCEGVRPDVRILDREMAKSPWMRAIAARTLPGLVLPGTSYGPPSEGGYDLGALFEANFDRMPIFVVRLSTTASFEKDDASWRGRFRFEPTGLVDRVRRQSEPFDPVAYLGGVEATFDQAALEAIARGKQGAWERLVQQTFVDALFHRATVVLQYALAHGHPPDLYARVLPILERAQSWTPQRNAGLLKNAGLAHFMLSQVGPEADRAQHRARAVEIWRGYLPDPEAGDPDLERIRKTVDGR